MTDYDKPPSGAALALLENEKLNEIFDNIERTAIESMVAARPEDDRQRCLQSMRVDVIRSVRKQLAEQAAGTVKRTRTGPAA